MLKLLFVFIYFSGVILSVNSKALGFDDEFDAFLNSNQPKVSKKEIIDPNKIQSGETENKKKRVKKVVEEKKEEPFKKSILSSVKQWTALTANPKGQKMCYAVIYAKRRVSNIGLKEGEQLKAYFMVHYFNPYRQRISIFFDYKIKKGSRIFLSIDGTQFEITPYESYAFAEDAETDATIINSLLKAKRVLVRGEGDENAYSVDEYEVSGFDSIYTQMKQQCGNMN